MPAKPFKRRGRWCAPVELPPDAATGQRRRRWLYGDTRRAVEAAQANLLRELATGSYLEPATLTVAQYLDRWLADVMQPGRAVTTWETAASHVRCWLTPQLGHHRLQALQPGHVAALLARVIASGRSPKTAINVRMTLHAALTQAVAWQLVATNVVDRVPPPRYEPVPRQMWTEAELARFLAACRGRRWETLYLVTLATGLRQGEALGLRWAAVDLARGLLTVSRQQVHTKTRGALDTVPKGRRGRALQLDPATVAVLAAHRIAQARERAEASAWEDGHRVFPNRTGGPQQPRLIQRDFARLVERAGLPPLPFHGLRHLHATYLMLQGVPVKVISERLGHASTAITNEVYSHVTPPMQQAAVQAFSAVYQRIQDAANQLPPPQPPQPKTATKPGNGCQPVVKRDGNGRKAAAQHKK